MSRKEEILRATIELASQYGLKSVTLAQIADRVGIRKPSLYNHFSSKDEIVQEAYRFLREQASGNSAGKDIDYAALCKERSLEEILLASFEQYCSFLLDEDLLRLFKVLYAERVTSPVAAQIVVDETEHMILQVRNLFYALAVHGKLRNDDVDMAALSFAMTVHALVDHQLDLLTAAGKGDACPLGSSFDQASAYISWFARQMEPAHA